LRHGKRWRKKENIMAKEENLLILKMLQEGTITAEQAAELLSAVESSSSRAVAPVAPVAPVTPVTPAVPIPPQLTAPLPPDLDDKPQPEGEIFARARERLAAAREKVAGVQEQLNAAEEKVSKAQESANPFDALADALKDVPGAKTISDALRDPHKLAANARRQARRMARQIRHSFHDMQIDINLNLAETMQGEPTLSLPREVSATIPPGSMLRVRNTLGDIEAIGADVPEARVAGLLKIWAADKATAEEIAKSITVNVEQGAEGPTISVSHPPKVRRVSLDLKAFIPQNGVRVSLLSPSGDVTARGIRAGVVLGTQSGDAKASEINGDVAAETASGDIALEGVTGNIQATTASGDLQAIRLTGQNVKAVSQSGDISVQEASAVNITVETVSGNAEVEKVSGRTLRIRSVSGDTQASDIAFEESASLETVSGSVLFAPRNPLSAGTISLNAISGDLELKLPAETNGSVEITTKSGDAEGKFKGADGKDQTISATGMTAVAHSIGSGSGVKIMLASVSGDISIRQE
jgi:DUF4097 and DUF4098 domain-containing protein YvlB